MTLVSDGSNYLFPHFFQNQEQSATRTNHLIIVAGHSVTVSGHLEDAGEDENDWYEIICV